jgi:hypothetical protein
MTEDKIENLYNSYLEFTDKMVGEYDPIEVAAIMVIQALSIYKTILSENEYNSMVDNISDRRDQVNTFNTQALQ